MTLRRDKRSISMPAELVEAVEAAAEAAGTSFSGWLAETAARRLKIEAGLAGVAAFEVEHGELSEAERVEGETWAREVASRTAKPRPRRKAGA